MNNPLIVAWSRNISDSLFLDRPGTSNSFASSCKRNISRSIVGLCPPLNHVRDLQEIRKRTSRQNCKHCTCPFDREKIAHAYLAASLIRLRRNKYTGDSGTKGNSTMYNKGNASIMIENNRYESTAPSI